MDIHHWNWAVWALVILQVLSLCAGIGMHGKEREGKYNAGVSLLIFLIGACLYYFAGVYQ